MGLYFVVGLPRAGKSCLCNEWVNYKFDIIANQFQPRLHESICEHTHIESTDKPRVIVCSDDIRLALHGCRWSSVAEEQVHAIQGVMIRSLLYRGFDVLVDGTHTTRKSIERMFGFDQDAQFIYVGIPASLCKKRAEETGQKDLCVVIDRMQKQIYELIHGDLTITVSQAINNIKDSMVFDEHGTIL